MLKQVMVAFVGIFRRAEAGKLAHRPELAPVHVGMNAAGIRKLARMADIAQCVDMGDVVGSVELLDRFSANGCKLDPVSLRTLSRFSVALRHLIDTLLFQLLIPEKVNQFRSEVQGKVLDGPNDGQSNATSA